MTVPHLAVAIFLELRLNIEIEGCKRLQLRQIIKRAQVITAWLDATTNAENDDEPCFSSVSMQQDSSNPPESNQFSNDFLMSFKLRAIGSRKAELQVMQEHLENGEVVI